MALKWILNQKTLSPRLARWALQIQDLDYSVKHVKGIKNVVPDCLSRRSYPYTSTSADTRINDFPDLASISVDWLLGDFCSDTHDILAAIHHTVQPSTVPSVVYRPTNTAHTPPQAHTTRVHFADHIESTCYFQSTDPPTSLLGLPCVSHDQPSPETRPISSDVAISLRKAL